MGSCQSSQSTKGNHASSVSPRGGNRHGNDDDAIMEVLTNSSHDPTKTTRQRMAWHREDVELSHVYDVLEIIGQGSMGEVCIVRKKPEFLGMSRVGSSSALSSLASAAVETKDGSVSLTSDEAATSGTGDVSNYTGSNGNKTHKSAGTRKYACKTVNTVRMKPDQVLEFINEIDILRDLDHPNIIQMFEVCSTKRKIWIIQELCTGGDLGERARKVDMKEPDVAVVIEQVLRAVSYMHKRNVCHRDIKFENIMYTDSSPDATIKLIDFGLSDKFTKGQKMLRACGTVYTAAPEVLLGQSYTEQSDVWSIGVVAYVLLSCEYPFLQAIEEMEDEAKRDKLANAQYRMGPGWKVRNISKFGKEFVAQCLRKHPGARWTALEALDFVQKVWIPYLMETDAADHKQDMIATPLGVMPAFSSAGSTPSRKMSSDLSEASHNEIHDVTPQHQPLRKSVAALKKRTRMHSGMVACMSNFAHHGEMKKRILMTMAYTMDKSSLGELQEIFTVLDSNNSGTISLGELKIALKNMHSDKHFDEHTIEKLFHGVDIDNSGEIHYAEFLAAVMESQGLITMERLADAFDRLDGDGKGYISRDDLKCILGSDYNEELVNKMIEEADYKKKGEIDYDEFLRLMFDSDPSTGMETVAPGKNLHEDRSMVDRLASFQSCSA